MIETREFQREIYSCVDTRDVCREEGMEWKVIYYSKIVIVFLDYEDLNEEHIILERKAEIKVYQRLCLIE